jgi:hypothetical protein
MKLGVEASFHQTGDPASAGHDVVLARREAVQAKFTAIVGGGEHRVVSARANQLLSIGEEPPLKGAHVDTWRRIAVRIDDAHDDDGAPEEADVDAFHGLTLVELNARRGFRRKALAVCHQEIAGLRSAQRVAPLCNIGERVSAVVIRPRLPRLLQWAARETHVGSGDWLGGGRGDDNAADPAQTRFGGSRRSPRSRWAWRSHLRRERGVAERQRRGQQPGASRGSCDDQPVHHIHGGVPGARCGSVQLDGPPLPGAAAREPRGSSVGPTTFAEATRSADATAAADVRRRQRPERRCRPG